MLRRLLPLALVGALTLSACGGDDESDDKAAATPTPAPAWVQEANAACTESQGRVAALAPDVAKEETDPAKAAALVIERSVPVQKAMFAKLEAVDVPEDVKGDYDEWTGQLEESLDLFPRLVKALRQGKEDPSLTTDAEDLAKAVQPFAEENGLIACVAGVQAPKLGN